MDGTCRFAVVALGAVTLSNLVDVAQLSGRTAPAVISDLNSLSPGQPPAGFSVGRTDRCREGPYIVN